MEGKKRQGGRGHALFAAAFAVSGLLAAPAASSFDFSFSDDDLGWGNWGQVDFTWNTRLTAGAQVRTESRDWRLVDKQNVPANQDIFIEGTGPTGNSFSGFFDICEIAPPEVIATAGTFAGSVSDCTAQFGDPRPGLRLVNAPGGYNINGDNGNLNYDRGDFTYANFQIRSELTAFWKNLTFRVSGIGYYDPVNNDFDTHLANRPLLQYQGRNFQNGQPPPGIDIETDGNPTFFTLPIDRSSAAQRRDDLEDRLGNQLRLLEAFVAGDFEIGGRTLRLGVGQQRMRWGESTFMIFNNLARINPPSAELYDRPGTEVRDAFIPVGMLTASMNVTTNFNVEAFYQYDWEPVEPSICGSFLAVSDVAGCGDGPTSIILGMGNTPEAPLTADLAPGAEPTDVQQARGDGLFRAGAVAGTQTSGTRTIHLEDEAFGYPENGGQFGLRLDYYADWLNGGTEISLYGMNIHSRLPFFSVLAAEQNCMTTAGVAGANGAGFFQAVEGCRGFDAINPTNLNDFNRVFNEGNYRVDTMRAFLDYPEDIGVFGLSATTNVGDWSLAGEVAYSPNQPAQIAVTDVAFAGVQPAFPIGGTSSGGASSLTDILLNDDDEGSFQNPQGAALGLQPLAPTNRLAVPDYISQYRCPDNVDLASLYGVPATNPDGSAKTNVDIINDISGAAFGALSPGDFGGRDDLVREMECGLATQSGDYIRGYERLKVGQASLTGIRVLGSSSPISATLNADQIIFVSELAAYKAFDMPGLNELQFQGAGASQTHYSQGVTEFDLERDGFYCASDDGCPDDDGDVIGPDEPIPLEEIRQRCSLASGSGDCVRRAGPSDRINYERADEDIFADDFAWGYRMRITADYNNALFGWKWTPGLLFYHDVHGTSISPGQDFVEDRKELTLSTNILFTNEFSANLQYRFYWGAGDRNLRQDRDYAEFALNYSF